MLSFFFFNDTATTEIYTLSLHDALPIWRRPGERRGRWRSSGPGSPGPTAAFASSAARRLVGGGRDRKSTRLNSSHSQISYAVFCLKKKKQTNADHSETPLHLNTSRALEF